MIGVQMFAVVGVDETGPTLSLRQRDQKAEWQVFIQLKQPAEHIRESLLCLVEMILTEQNRQTMEVQEGIEKMQSEIRELGQ